MNNKSFWFRFFKNWYGVSFTHKEDALFSIRNGYKKSIYFFNYYIYILKPIK